MSEREWVEKQIGTEILAGMDDTVFHFYYKAMYNYGMDFCDADRYAWLNTLFGYDIGAERAKALINQFWVNEELDVMELGIMDKEYVESVAKELGFHFNYSGWAKEEPKAIVYGLPEFVKGECL